MYQIVIEVEKELSVAKDTAMQIGATVVKFLRDEEKFISELVSKEIADAAKSIPGATVSEVTQEQADAKKAQIEKANQDAAAQIEKDKTEADAAEAQAKADGEEKAKEQAKTEADAAAAEQAKRAESATNELIEKAKTDPAAIVGSEIAKEIGNATGPEASLVQPDTTEREPAPALVPHQANGDGGTSWSPEDGKPAGNPAPADVQPQSVAKARDAKAKATQGIGAAAPAKDGPQPNK